MLKKLFNLLIYIAIFFLLATQAANAACLVSDFTKDDCKQGEYCIDILNAASECYSKIPDGYAFTGTCTHGIWPSRCVDKAPTPTFEPTPTDDPANCLHAGTNCSVDDRCCHADGLVCASVPPYVDRSYECIKCNVQHAKSCNPGSIKAGECCAGGLTCASRSSSGNDPVCLTHDEFENPPTINLKNPCSDASCPTALGDIPITPTGFVQAVFRLVLSLSGGIAIILIVISGYRLSLSQGNPEKVQQAREMLTSAIVGLLFIIFSLTILQIIGVDILGLGAGKDFFLH